MTSTTKVEKGQRYKGMNNATYEILTEPFMHGDTEKVVYLGSSGVPYIDRASCFESDHFTLIREPKFKVGDRVAWYDAVGKVIAVSSEADYEGEFSYILKDDNNEHDHTYESRLKAAE
jgi:hypothetical protein